MRQRDQSLLMSACQCFRLLGPISTKTMFGGFGLYQASVMFALISEEKFYLRGCGNLEKLFQQRNTENFIYTKRGRPVVLRYYFIDEQLWHNPPLLLQYARQSIEGAQQDKEHKIVERSTRLKDLPNLGLSSERLLRRVGIESIEDLRNLGAVRAYLRLKNYSRDISLNLLWSLAGALAGCHATVVSDDVRHALLESLQALKL